MKEKIEYAKKNGYDYFDKPKKEKNEKQKTKKAIWQEEERIASEFEKDALDAVVARAENTKPSDMIDFLLFCTINRCNIEVAERTCFRRGIDVGEKNDDYYDYREPLKKYAKGLIVKQKYGLIAEIGVSRYTWSRYNTAYRDEEFLRGGEMLGVDFLLIAGKHGVTLEYNDDDAPNF